jgi:hypothetical protein
MAQEVKPLSSKTPNSIPSTSKRKRLRERRIREREEREKKRERERGRGRKKESESKSERERERERKKEREEAGYTTCFGLSVMSGLCAQTGWRACLGGALVTEGRRRKEKKEESNRSWTKRSLCFLGRQESPSPMF